MPKLPAGVGGFFFGRFPLEKSGKTGLAALGVVLVALGLLLAFLVHFWVVLGDLGSLLERSWGGLGRL